MLEIVENKERPALRYVLYVRKSSEDDKAQVKSLEDQIADCLSYAKIRGLEVVDTIQESASAKKSKKSPPFHADVKRYKQKEVRRHPSVAPRSPISQLPRIGHDRRHDR